MATTWSLSFEKVERESSAAAEVLRYLMVNAGRVLSKGQILDQAWDYGFNGDSNVVESCVSYLRRKVDRCEPRLIHTIRSMGYILRIPPP